MKAIVINEFHNSLDLIHVSDVAKPTPKADELLIQVKAAGVNFVDTLYVRFPSQVFSLSESLILVRRRPVASTRTIVLSSSHPSPWVSSSPAPLYQHPLHPHFNRATPYLVTALAHSPSSSPSLRQLLRPHSNESPHHGLTPTQRVWAPRCRSRMVPWLLKVA